MAIAQVLGLLLLTGVALLASIMGYANASPVDSLGEVARNQFNVLHLFALPGILGMLLVGWYWSFRPRLTPAP